MLKSVCAALMFVATLSILAAQAQNTAPQVDGNQIVRSITMNDMRTITASYGHTVIEEHGDQDGIVVQTPEGFKYLVLLKGCDERGFCAGVLIGSIHDLPPGLTWPLLNQFDMQVDAFGMYVANNQLVIDRFVILSGGVQVESFAHEIATLIRSAPGIVASLTELAAAASG